jgi:hypothetical protein
VADNGRIAAESVQSRALACQTTLNHDCYDLLLMDIQVTAYATHIHTNAFFLFTIVSFYCQ